MNDSHRINGRKFKGIKIKNKYEHFILDPLLLAELNSVCALLQSGPETSAMEFASCASIMAIQRVQNCEFTEITVAMAKSLDFLV